MKYTKRQEIDVNDIVGYTNLDTAIEDLIKLRDELKSQGFNNSTIDYEQSPIPYDDNFGTEVQITVTVS